MHKCYLARGECPSMLAIPAVRCCSLICHKAPDLSSNPPVIAARPFTIPYLTALLPSELEMQQMEETDSSEQDEQTDTENLPLHISPVGPAFCLLQRTPHPTPRSSLCCSLPVSPGVGQELLSLWPLVRDLHDGPMVT